MISRHLPGRLRFGITTNGLIWRVGSRASSSVERRWIRPRRSSYQGSPVRSPIFHFSASAICGRTITATRRTYWHWRMQGRRHLQQCPHASIPSSPGQSGRRAWPPTQIRRSPASSCGASAPASALGSLAASGVNTLSATSNQLVNLQQRRRVTVTACLACMVSG